MPRVWVQRLGTFDVWRFASDPDMGDLQSFVMTGRASPFELTEFEADTERDFWRIRFQSGEEVKVMLVCDVWPVFFEIAGEEMIVVQGSISELFLAYRVLTAEDLQAIIYGV